MHHVPVIDISNPSATESAAVDRACADHGFFLLRGHGLDDLIERTFQEGQRLFAADRSVKDSIARTIDNPLGYYDRELTKRVRDHKEVFDYIDPDKDAGRSRNRWPDGLIGYQETLVEFFDAFSDLAERTVALVHDTLGLSGEVADRHRGSRRASTVRLNHYNIGDPVPEEQRGELADLAPVALGHHTDPGVLTLLLQDGVGGLQAESAEHGWIDVEPEPGTIVVNLGDVMQVWTNDRYRAAVHRVLPMTTSTRMSIPYFFNPSPSLLVEPIRELDLGADRYRPFVWAEFMQARIDDNFTDEGDDTQISDYAVAQ
ncbi:MAG: 2OG-Fe(II) oxygenase family protein [Acidimicrobiales bacterium]